MLITYNQEQKITLEKEISLKEFLQLQNLQIQGIAVAVDEKIIKKTELESFILKDGMAVDVYNMVSGG
jgi:thiamine biosynthesis protein ThiS